MINKMIIKLMPLVPKSIVYLFAKKYIAGPYLNDAVRVTQELEEEGGMSTIDVLGEFVTDRKMALHEKEMCGEVLDAIHQNKLKSYLSVKPTSLGLGIDYDFGFENIKELLDKASSYNIFVRLDMENSPYTDKTLKMYRQFRNMGYENIGIVLQSYMRRSIDDIKSVIDLKPNVRLCKGIYNEAPEIAYKGFKEVQDNFKKMLRLMLDNGFYVGVATHDEELIQDAETELKRRNMKPEEYEFQMLLGVREDRRKSLIAAGHRMRVYTPYGEDWYGYSSRRLKENPAMVGHIVKSIFGMGK